MKSITACRLCALVLLALLSLHRAHARTYYINAATGNDADNGLSPSSAWRTLERVNALSLEAGDKVLLGRGMTYTGVLEVKAAGTKSHPVIIGAYGEGAKPRIAAPDHSPYAVRVYNSDHVTVQDLDIENHGSERMRRRTGIKVECDNKGTSQGIQLLRLCIHDVNGSLHKSEGGGSGILVFTKGDRVKSNYDGLRIEQCLIRRCERNAIIWEAPWSRTDWHPSTNTVVRYNLIEEVPGDGIVPIGCEGAVVEYNLMRWGTAILPRAEAAAAIWPWSCDNTVIRFNEVSGHKAPWDGQGFDSDYNCTNTLIEYNYSHDNDGGFLLICNSGNSRLPHSIGNIGSIVRHNVSIGDAVRPRATHDGIFSPTIHIAGPVRNTLVSRNILIAEKKPSPKVHRSIVTSNSWDGYADSTSFEDNIFLAAEPTGFSFTESTNNRFSGNRYIGEFADAPADYSPSSLDGQKLKENAGKLFKEVTVGDGAATMKVVEPKRIKRFFRKQVK